MNWKSFRIFSLSRFIRMLLLLGTLASPLLSPSRLAADGNEDRKKTYQETPTDQAISRAIAFLLRQQNQDGAINSTPTHQTAMTSLSILAISAAGHLPTDPTREGEALRKALKFVLRNDRQQPDGYFGLADASTMYGHGITTLMLAEVLGMGVDPAQDQIIREKCQKGVDLILRTQKVVKPAPHAGGWRYQPASVDSDISITIWQVMALRAAKNAGLDVPKEAIDAAIGFVKRCYKSPHDSQGKPTNLMSAFGYIPGGLPIYAEPSAGLLALQVCGEYDAPEVYGTADWLRKHKPAYNSVWGFYAMYYFAQGMYQRGGEYAEEGRQHIEAQLLPKQAADGSWTTTNPGEANIGKVYCTTLSILSLAVKHHYLPIYQR